MKYRQRRTSYHNKDKITAMIDQRVTTIKPYFSSAWKPQLASRANHGNFDSWM